MALILRGRGIYGGMGVKVESMSSESEHLTKTSTHVYGV